MRFATFESWQLKIPLNLVQGRRSIDEEWNGSGERMGRAGNWMDEDFPGAERQLPTLSDNGGVRGRDPKHSPTQSNISAPPTFGDGFRPDYNGALTLAQTRGV
jgi:hypothetical protein